jgi:DNA-binding NarL/FixJ family response regulator
VIVETGAAVTTQTVTTETVLALYAQGLSQRAIAAHLGCSRATVRRRMAATA